MDRVNEIAVKVKILVQRVKDQENGGKSLCVKFCCQWSGYCSQLVAGLRVLYKKLILIKNIRLLLLSFC